jgi:F-type H+-transporting ATPase subunit a
MTEIIIPPLAAEPIFHIGSFPITNTYINSSLTVLLFIVLAFFVQRSITFKGRPSKLQNFIETIVETLLGYFDQVTGDRKKSLRFFPLIGSLFLFIVVSNWLGLFPGIGSLYINEYIHGSWEHVPVLRSANTDLNLTIAMAVLGVVLSHVIGVTTIGFYKYLNKFIKARDVWAAFKSKKIMNIFTAFIELGVGLIEIISEVAKMVSLSLRLFGNVFAGEVLLTVLAGIIAVFVPLPFMVLEILVGLIQATVFSMLVLVYISVATMPVPDHSEGHGSHGKESHAH